MYECKFEINGQTHHPEFETIEEMHAYLDKWCNGNNKEKIKDITYKKIRMNKYNKNIAKTNKGKMAIALLNEAIIDSGLDVLTEIQKYDAVYKLMGLGFCSEAKSTLEMMTNNIGQDIIDLIEFLNE